MWVARQLPTRLVLADWLLTDLATKVLAQQTGVRFADLWGRTRIAGLVRVSAKPRGMDRFLALYTEVTKDDIRPCLLQCCINLGDPSICGFFLGSAPIFPR